jgi:hypothetical protein
MAARPRGAKRALAVPNQEPRKLWIDSHSRELLPWFYLTARATEAWAASGRTINDAVDIPEIAKSVQIVTLSIATPSWMNHSETWQLDSVTEMWIAADPDPIRENTIAMFITKTGTKYFVGAIDPTEAELHGLRRVDFR